MGRELAVFVYPEPHQTETHYHNRDRKAHLRERIGRTLNVVLLSPHELYVCSV